VDKKERFTAAIKENEGFIFKIASIYTSNVEDRNDLLQEIFYQLWKSFDGFKQRSSISTWIYRVALNVSIYQLKLSKKKIATIPLDEQVLNTEMVNQENEDDWKLFRQQIDDLNLVDKAIVMLYLDNKSHEEIAAIIGITKTNVGTKLQRIKEKLKSQISKKI
jgi:RNA polymerase sigma-70 factor (ECF subfamily)